MKKNKTLRRWIKRLGNGLIYDKVPVSSDGCLTKACTGAAGVSFLLMASVVRRPGDASR